jgi:hypothetical protein
LEFQSPLQLTTLLQQQDDLYQKVITPTSLYHDCETFLSLTQIAVNQVSSVNIGPRSLSFTNIVNKTPQKFSKKGVFDLKKLG